MDEEKNINEATLKNTIRIWRKGTKEGKTDLRKGTNILGIQGKLKRWHQHWCYTCIGQKI